MGSIELFCGIKQEFYDLKYKDKDQLDKLKRRLRMLVTNILGKGSSYYSEIVTITYFPSVSYSNMPESIGIDAWDFGKNRTINLIDTIIEELELFPKAVHIESINDKSIDRSKVFIVHGHDDGAVDKVARFVGKLGFEAIILHEQSSSGDTIIEKIIRYSDVGFGIVLYTECDVGAVKSQPENLRSRARQNVVFEHGFLIGKIGKENVTALVKGNIEKPNDISGVVYISLDESDGWKSSLAREMIASGYDVDMKKFL